MSDGRCGPDLGVGPRLEPSSAPAARDESGSWMRRRLVDDVAIRRRYGGGAHPSFLLV